MDCHRATFLIEKRQEAPLTRRERIELFIHLLGCSVCRLYRKQSQMIGHALKRVFDRSPEQTLDDGLKRRMQDEINERLRR